MLRPMFKVGFMSGSGGWLGFLCKGKEPRKVLIKVQGCVFYIILTEHSLMLCTMDKNKINRIHIK